MKTLIKNVKIIQENEILFNHQVLLNDKLIVKILPDSQTLDYDELIDGQGLYLAPGFIDIHNHGNSNCDVMDGKTDALETMAKFHISNGVTSFCGATMTNPVEKINKALKTASEYIDTQSEQYSRMLGIYLEGPFFNSVKKGAQPGEDIKLPDISILKNFIDSCNNKIIVVALAPELEGAKEMIDYCVSNDIKVALGHTNANYEDAQKGIDSGATLCTHLYNGMRAFTHREPGVIGACLTNDSLRAEMICDGIHIHKTAVDMAIRCKTTEGIVLISDAMRAAGLPDGQSELGGQIVNCINGEARLLDGSLAGSTLNLNKAVRNMIKLYNRDIREAVNMASINPARAIGKEKIIGSIEEGKLADLQLFDEEINIKHVIRDGITVI